MLLIALGLVLAMIGLLFSPGGIAITFTGLALVFFNIGCFKIINIISPSFYAYRFLVIFYLLQPIFFFLVTIIYSEDLEYYFATTSLYNSYPISLWATFGLIPSLGLLFAVILKPFANQNSHSQSLISRLIIDSKTIKIFLVIGTIVNIAIWPATAFSDNLIWYILRVTQKTFIFIPLLAGLYFKRYRWITFLWFVSLSIGFSLSSLTGSRGYGYWPILFYCIGFILQIERKNKRLLAWCSIVVFFPIALFISGMVDIIRNEFDRTNLKEMNVVRAAQIFSDFDDMLRQSVENISSITGRNETGFYKGLTRMVYWPDIIILNMAGETVPYRGFDDFYYEFLNMFKITGIGVRGADVGSSQFGVIIASDYGFTVSRTSTVPFSILPDGWTRGGLVTATIYVFISFIFISVIEHINIKLNYNYPATKIIGFMVIAGMAFNYFTVYPLLNSIRQMILLYTFTLVLCRTLELLENPNRISQ